MAEKLRVGVIGCGEMTLNHTFGYLNSSRYEVTGLADLSEQAMKDFDEQFSEYSDYKAEHFMEAREMLERSKPDIVSVGVWDKGHAPMTIAAGAWLNHFSLAVRAQASNEASCWLSRLGVGLGVETSVGVALANRPA